MENNPSLPDSNHITRYCKPTDAPDGQIQATAFMMRPSDDCLSINWLEYFNCSSREDEINEIRKVYFSKFNRVSANARIAVLNVGTVKGKVLTESEDRRNIEILHNPQLDDPSHSGIYNLRVDDMLISELILETVLENYPARY